MAKKITILGAGVASLSSACFLAKEGYDVTILEKNPTIGGRGRQFSEKGFTFDMGPSWYWMPDVFDRFYEQFGYKSSDFYELKRLNPSYRVFWPDQNFTDIPANMNEVEALFEELEPGSSIKLRLFLKDAKYKYEVGMQDLVHKPSLSIFEFVDIRILKGLMNMHLFSSFSTYIRKYFKHPKILSLLEFPVLFLGAMPNDTPALYSLMNYADISLGTWYPMGGMYKFVEAFEKIAIEQGVKIKKNSEVTGFKFDNNRITGAIVGDEIIESDIFVSGADYQHTDIKLLKEKANYKEKYWNKRTMAPSSLLFYIGINKRVKNLQHHNLFFDESLEFHGKEIYKDPKWPSAPLFYLSVSSLTDSSVAPENCENMFFLIPIAPDLKDSEEIRENYFKILLERLKNLTGNDISENIIFKRSYCISDFKKDYNAFKGNAYGLANTLMQTAILKPSLKNKKITNLYYTGQLTVPGPGIPPSIISGEVVAKEIIKTHGLN
jgi:phytoene desaturase